MHLSVPNETRNKGKPSYTLINGNASKYKSMSREKSPLFCDTKTEEEEEGMINARQETTSTDVYSPT